MKSNKHWFRKRHGLRSKDLGYGWVPISWEGWVSIAVMLAGIFGIMWYFGILYDEPRISESTFLFIILAWILLFALFARSKSRD